jgi:hypothetical protein
LHRCIPPTRTPLGAFQRAGMCARACVTWAGGVLTAVSWPVQNAKGVDSVRRRQVAAPSGPAAGTPMPRLPPAPEPAQAIACGRAFRRSAHEAHRRPLLSGTAACSAVTVLQLYPTPNLPHHSAAGWHACNHTEHRRCTAAACGTHVQPAMRSKPGADDAPDGTEGYSRGTQGTEGCSRVLGSWIECMQAL